MTGMAAQQANGDFSRAPARMAAVVAALWLATLPAGPAQALPPGAAIPAPAREKADSGPVIEVLEATPLPQPGPAIDRSAVARDEIPPSGNETEKDGAAPENGENDADAAEDQENGQVEIIHDLSTLPEPVKATRERIVEAAASGDIERLRPLIGAGDGQSAESRGDDAVETLRGLSGDQEGHEILAILLDVLATGVARFNAGTPEEAYVWPYFTGKPLSLLTPPERVELLRIITAGDLAGMEEDGSYNFFRIAIAPDGTLKSFSGGE